MKILILAILFLALFQSCHEKAPETNKKINYPSHKEDKGGAGASFIVEWGASKNANQMLFQSVMIGTTGQQGISFTSKGEVISRREKK